MKNKKGNVTGGIVLIVLSLSIIFIVFGGMISLTKPAHDKLFAAFKSVPDKLKTFNNPDSDTKEYVMLTSNSWCSTREILVGGKPQDVVRDHIIGWDVDNKCCVRQIEGYNCALQKDGEMKYCYTSNIGGIIKYVRVNGNDLSVTNYKSYLDDFDKFQIQGKTCDASLYGG